MLKETTTIDYAVLVVGILDGRSEPAAAAEIAELLAGSPSYIAKVLQRMSAAGLLRSGAAGYELTRPASAITAADLLSLGRPTYASGKSEEIAQDLLELAKGLPISKYI